MSLSACPLLSVQTWVGVRGAVAHTGLASEESIRLADILISRTYKSVELLQGPNTEWRSTPKLVRADRPLEKIRF